MPLRRRLYHVYIRLRGRAGTLDAIFTPTDDKHRAGRPAGEALIAALLVLIRRDSSCCVRSMTECNIAHCTPLAAAVVALAADIWVPTNERTDDDEIERIASDVLRVTTHVPCHLSVCLPNR